MNIFIVYCHPSEQSFTFEVKKTVMIGDRMNGRAETCEMIVFDEMTRGYGNDGKRNENIQKFVQKAYQIGVNL